MKHICFHDRYSGDGIQLTTYSQSASVERQSAEQSATRAFTSKMFLIIIATAMLLICPLAAETTAQSNTTDDRATSRSISRAANRSPMSSGASFAVLGSGTVGRVTKWVGFNTNSFIGDSTIFEDKIGNVGVGTDTPTSRLTVQGMVETTLGGYKFPDGTIQTTALSSGDVVRTLNGLKGNVFLFGSSTVAIDTVGDNLAVHVALPLILTGFHELIFSATSTAPRGDAIHATGGDSANGKPGFGVVAKGGSCNFCGSIVAGVGVLATGGQTTGDVTGQGVVALGGDANVSGGFSAEGVFAGAGLATNGAMRGAAILTDGDVVVQGDLMVTGNKNFKIDHPLDPANKYLLHAAIESSEVLNIYSGNVVLGPGGEAVVTLPAWFEVINRDFRYQLTPIGGPGQGVYIAEEINGNRFKIAGGAPEMKVSWQVTGVRSDPGSRQHPFSAEKDKPQRERGTYLNPQAVGQPEEKGFLWTRLPELMQQRKEARAWEGAEKRQ
jgi:hypothetical protein